jgi:hypothetical protein
VGGLWAAGRGEKREEEARCVVSLQERVIGVAQHDSISNGQAWCACGAFLSCVRVTTAARIPCKPLITMPSNPLTSPPTTMHACQMT